MHLISKMTHKVNKLGVLLFVAFFYLECPMSSSWELFFSVL
jgi:hypothetical protein